MQKGQYPPQIVLEKLGMCMQRNEVRSLTCTIYKDIKKIDLRLNGRPESMKLLEQNEKKGL